MGRSGFDLPGQRRIGGDVSLRLGESHGYPKLRPFLLLGLCTGVNSLPNHSSRLKCTVVVPEKASEH